MNNNPILENYATGEPYFSNMGSFDFLLDSFPELNLTSNRHPSLAANEYTQGDLIANMIYIFLVLVFSTMVFAGISFGIREYVISLRTLSDYSEAIELQENRKWSQNNKPEDVPSKDATMQAGNAATTIPVSLQSSEEVNSFIESKPTGSDLIQEVDHSVLVKQPQDNGGYLESGITDPGPEAMLRFSFDESESDRHTDLHRYLQLSDQKNKFEKIEVVHDEIDSPSLNSPPLSSFLRTQFDLEKEPPKKSAKYSFRELREIKKSMAETQLITEENVRNKTIKMSSIMKYSTLLPVRRFESVWSAEKTINDIRMVLSNKSNELVSQRLCLWSLFSICASYKIYDNPNYFLSVLNDFLENFIDSGDLIVVVEKVEPDEQRLLVELILIYFWSHWNFKKRDTTRVQDQFKAWKVFEPAVQSHQEIFRLVCNFEIGIGSIKFSDHLTRVEAKFKIHTLLKEIASASFCNDFMAIIPMLAQAVGLTEEANTKYRFYEALRILVSQHSDCCMVDYINETNTDLRALVQHGLWHKHDTKVCNIANKIFEFLVLRHPRVQAWWDDVEGGKLYAASAVEPQTKDTLELCTAPQTPGSWNIVVAPERRNIGARSKGSHDGSKLSPQRQRSIRRNSMPR